ncbi:chemotaxis protein CheW [Pelomonas sp. UHG3]|uniref:Chemotaxis protein CheW n=1 Tax=Roseateles hydrophilus TaxID=2975054 RepID=A0ACC6C703_9BURK|nr:chemotaxis protein CheW [Pelomonas sp. UHG3]MCY4744177.1 chemotaxis protein CheW [Pelomonas sp. UHG3]
MDTLDSSAPPGALQAPADGQFVSFELAGEKFAVPMGPVQEIIRLPEVARLPLAPAALLGLANLRGRVLPLMSLRRLVGLPDLAQNDAARALVINCGQALGFLVDTVLSVLHVEPGELQPAAGIQSVVQTDCLTGLIRRPGANGHDDLLMVLDFELLVQRAFRSVMREPRDTALDTGGREALSRSLDAAEGDALNQDLRMVSFTVAGQEYALPIEDVQEIVQLPDSVTALPQAPAHVRGVITLRQRLLPLVDLRSLFRLGLPAQDEHQRIVVVSLDGCGPVGLVTDAVKEVLSVPRTLSDDVPDLLSRDGQLAEFSAICRLDDGRRLVSVLSSARLIGLEEVREAAALAGALQQAPEQPVESSMQDKPKDSAMQEDLQLVIFRLGAEEFGVPIMCVQEIVRVPEQLTKVPRTPAFVEGVINLRGAVLPVIDQRSRLGLEPLARNDRQRIMVFTLGEQRTGFIVDSVAEVLRVPRHCLAPAPQLSDAQGRMIREVARLDEQQRLIMLIDPPQLLQWQAQANLDMAASDLAEPLPEPQRQAA